MDWRDNWVYLSSLVLLWIPYALSRGPPQMNSDADRRITENAGTTLRLICHVEADPPPLIQWMKWNEDTKDDEIINSAWDRYRMLKNVLKIKEATPEDTGKFTCRATNGFGSIDVDYWIHVKTANETDSIPPWARIDAFNSESGGKPHFQKKEQMVLSYQRPIGSIIKLKCKASGRPKPDIIWFKDGDVFNGGGSIGVSPEHKWSITLDHVQPEDSGKYMCKVFNRHGSINHTYTLDVIDRHKSIPELMAPHPLNQTVPYGGMATFQCKIISAVQPHIQWLKRVDNAVDARDKNHTITIEKQDFIVLQTSQVWPSTDGTHYLNKLTLHRVTEHDAGLYICLGINSMGHSFRPAYLKVLPNPDRIENSDYDYSSSFDSPSLPLIIAVPAVVIIIIVVIALYMLQRRRNNAKNQRPVTTVVARQPRLPPIHKPMTAQEKMFAEQYTALHPQIHHTLPHNGMPSTMNGMPPSVASMNGMNPHAHNGLAPVHGIHMMPQAPSREHLYNMNMQKAYDLHSDISIAKMAQPSVMQPLTQNHIHNHNIINNHNLDLHNQGQGQYYSTYDNC